MTPKRIFITGASGCIGHYIVETLIQNTQHELFLLIRNPAKLKFDYQVRPGITLIQGDMRGIEQWSDLLSTMDCAVVVATSWGGTEETFEVNVVKTLQLMELLNPERCEQVIYFSTASLLGQDNQPLTEAGELGTDYIRSKYECFRQLPQLAIAPRITTLFPTLVLGGDPQKPYSHLSAGLADVMKWMDVIRFIKADGSFHFIHGRDIAQVVHHLIDHPPSPQSNRQLVLGNQRVTANQLIEEACAYLNKKIYFRLSLSWWLANFIIVVFRIQMAAWDRFCFNYRHFTYENPVNPSTFHLPTYCATVADVLKTGGIPDSQTKIS